MSDWHCFLLGKGTAKTTICLTGIASCLGKGTAKTAICMALLLVWEKEQQRLKYVLALLRVLKRNSKDYNMSD
jgi:hypothetical protein